MSVDAADLLNRVAEVWRVQTSADGAGGEKATWGRVGTVRARLSQPTDVERTAALQSGVDLTHVAYLAPAADVRRGDELRVEGLALQVLATFGPSEPGVYLRADCRSRQSEGGSRWPAPARA